jgi:flagellar biosynthesis chaperone FliJ
MEQKVKDQNILVQQKVQELANTQKEYKKLNNKAETMKNKIDISQSIQSFHESSNYKMKINNLQNEIKKSTEKGDRLEAEIENQKKRWNEMYEDTFEDLKMKIDQSNSERSLQQI